MNFFQFLEYAERYIPYPEYAVALLIAVAALIVWGTNRAQPRL